MAVRLLAVWLLLLGAAAFAQVPVPPLKARVTDLTQTLSPAQRQGLEQKLAAFEQQQGSQVAVLIVPTTQPETIEQYGIRVAEQWKLGRAEPDDGVLLLVAKNDRAVRLEVGYGLEGAIPDAIAKRIVEEDIIPHFRQNQFAAGIHAGVDRVFGLIRGESLPPPRARAQAGTASQGGAGGVLPLLIVAMVFGQMLRRMLGPLLGGAVVGGGLFALGWLVFGALGLGLVLGIAGFFLTLIGVIGGGPFIMGGGGFGRGGFGGGGFGGGGGGFGGGGASGRW